MTPQAIRAANRCGSSVCACALNWMGDWRERSGLRALDKQITDRLQLLGFTPADRTRLGVAEVRVEDDLEAFRKAAK